MLRAFVAYWYAQRGANLVTRRADFEIFRFAPLLPHIFLYDYDSRTRELTLRLAGEEIRRMLPNSVAGTPLDRIMPARALPAVLARYRSAERRVGKGGVSTCRSRWSPSP